MNVDFKKTKDDMKGNYTFISGLYNGEVASFIRNEMAINEKNSFIHTPFAGVLFCSSLDANRSHITDDWHSKLNPTSKIERFNHLQSSKDSEATTAKATMKYFMSQKFKNTK